jgi:uncharacterized membrane protein
MGMSEPIRTLTTVTALGSGLVAGVLFAFSTSVMPGLSRLAPAQAVSAMQHMNAAILNPWFLGAFAGTAAASAALGVASLFRLDEPAGPYLLAGSVLYLAAFVMTMAYHVPRNDALATLDPDSAGAARAWAAYLTEWTRWNHARVILAVSAAATLTLSLRVR